LPLIFFLEASPQPPPKEGEKESPVVIFLFRIGYWLFFIGYFLYRAFDLAIAQSCFKQVTFF
jgi:hypothetical protein